MKLPARLNSMKISIKYKLKSTKNSEFYKDISFTIKSLIHKQLILIESDMIAKLFASFVACVPLTIYFYYLINIRCYSIKYNTGYNIVTEAKKLNQNEFEYNELEKNKLKYSIGLNNY